MIHLCHHLESGFFFTTLKIWSPIKNLSKLSIHHTTTPYRFCKIFLMSNAFVLLDFINTLLKTKKLSSGESYGLFKHLELKKIKLLIIKQQNQEINNVESPPSVFEGASAPEFSSLSSVNLIWVSSGAKYCAV